MDQLDQMYQVCELEESGNIKLSHFERFSVTAVPESWIILLKDGTLLCFWPSVNPASKVRSLHTPEIGEKCKYYKCRILLDGAKFSSYEEAEEAVQIAQNVSSMKDFSVPMETQEIENALESTMNFDVDVCTNGYVNSDDIVRRYQSGFDVSDYENEETKIIPGSHSFGFDVSDADDEAEEIAGNDSFEFNKAILKGGRYLSKRVMKFEVEDLQIDANYSVLSDADYNAKFESNDVNFSTSTEIDKNSQPVLKKSKLREIMLKISKIEMYASSFAENMQYELNGLKEAVKSLKKHESKVVPDISSNCNLAKEEEISGNKSNVQLEKTVVVPSKSQSNLVVEDVEYDNRLNETFVTKVAYVSEHTSDELTVQRENVKLVPLISEVIVELTEKSTSESAHTTDALSDERPKILNVEILPVHANIQNIPVDVAQDEPNLIHEVAEHIENPDDIDELRFPYDEVVDHIRNEDLLGDEPYDSALVEFLRPDQHEDEGSYIERSVDKLFTRKFLLNYVSWKKENNRMNIKGSKLLSVWKRSIAKRFQNVDDKKLQGHFRRIKSKFRAQIKVRSATSKKK